MHTCMQLCVILKHEKEPAMFVSTNKSKVIVAFDTFVIVFIQKLYNTGNKYMKNKVRQHSDEYYKYTYTYHILYMCKNI